MAEWKHLIAEWLAEYAALDPSELRSFATEHEHNHEIATAIHGLLCEEDLLDHRECKSELGDQYNEVLESVCVQLFSFYRSKEPELQRFTLQFVPTLTYTYLSTVARGNKGTYRCIETLLIGIHNFEVVDDVGKPKVVAFRLPSLAQASIYHEPSSLAPQFLTENALKRWEDCNSKLVSWGPMQQVEVLNAQNRLKVMTALMFVYNQNISSLPKMSLRYLCSAASKIVNEGFKPMPPSTGPGRSWTVPRIQISQKFLLEMALAAYFAMFNEFYTLAYQVVNDIDMRASYELMTEVMLVTGAIINSIKTNPSGQPCDGPMGIGVALTPATASNSMSKSMITNASFRTKKLPDDIPIQVGDAPLENAEVLTAITEEGEGDAVLSQRGSALRTSKPKQLLSGLKKFKEGKEKSASNKNGGIERKVVIKDSKMKGDGDNTSPLPQIKVDVNSVSSNGLNDDKTSISMEGSDTHSQVATSDSLDLETSRMPPMQISSV